MADKPDFALLRVMVIDDESFMRNLIIRILSEVGVTDVSTARDGAEALETLSDESALPNVIICDLEMPEMNGFEFVRNLRKHDRLALRNLPVLIVTGHADPQDVYAAVDAGIHGYLVKPISRHTLESRIAMALTSEPIDPNSVPR